MNTLIKFIGEIGETLYFMIEAIFALLKTIDWTKFADTKIILAIVAVLTCTACPMCSIMAIVGIIAIVLVESGKIS